jgi:hypothetical protein
MIESESNASLQVKAKDSKWYDNAGKVAGMAAILALFGQLLASVIPIWLGPSDLSDFNINIDKVYYEIGVEGDDLGLLDIQQIKPLSESSVNNIEIKNNNINIYSTINITNLHSIIKPYPHTVFIRVINPPRGFYFIIKNPEGKPDFETQMEIQIPFDEFKTIIPGNYPVVIQGLGGDGRIRNCTCYISVKDNLIGSHLTLYNESDAFYFRIMGPTTGINITNNTFIKKGQRMYGSNSIYLNKQNKFYFSNTSWAIH